jgi:hypothetical protein
MVIAFVGKWRTLQRAAVGFSRQVLDGELKFAAARSSVRHKAGNQIE